MDTDELRKLMNEQGASGDPAWEKLFTLNDDFQNIVVDHSFFERQLSRPTHYYRDGKPILDDELMPAFMRWAMLFETEDRTVAKTRTLYGERLSTIFLGLDHNFGFGPPILFETMLFAPGEKRRLGRLLQPSTMTEAEREEEKAQERETARRYPHDQLQIRYRTEREAHDRHETLALQCLIPPRWRHFLLWTVGKDETWRLYNHDEDED
jgi:hypothetical protein